MQAQRLQRFGIEMLRESLSGCFLETVVYVSLPARAITGSGRCNTGSGLEALWL